MMSKEKLLSTSDVIHIVLTKHDGDDVVLVSSHALEWRNCLACEQVAMTTRIELMGVGVLTLLKQILTYFEFYKLLFFV